MKATENTKEFFKKYFHEFLKLTYKLRLCDYTFMKSDIHKMWFSRRKSKREFYVPRTPAHRFSSLVCNYS